MPPVGWRTLSAHAAVMAPSDPERTAGCGPAVPPPLLHGPTGNGSEYPNFAGCLACLADFGDDLPARMGPVIRKVQQELPPGHRAPHRAGRRPLYSLQEGFFRLALEASVHLTGDLRPWLVRGRDCRYIRGHNVRPTASLIESSPSSTPIQPRCTESTCANVS